MPRRRVKPMIEYVVTMEIRTQRDVASWSAERIVKLVVNGEASAKPTWFSESLNASAREAVIREVISGRMRALRQSQTNFEGYTEFLLREGFPALSGMSDGDLLLELKRHTPITIADICKQES